MAPNTYEPTTLLAYYGYTADDIEGIARVLGSDAPPNLVSALEALVVSRVLEDAGYTCEIKWVPRSNDQKNIDR